jgi:citrate synthase
MPKDTLTIRDDRTGKEYVIPIEHGTIRATDLAQIKVDADDPGIASYDPGFMNTAACKSAIGYIDGDKGILRYRGYPIEELAEKSTYLETAYLVVKGELPTTSHLKMWTRNIKMHTMVHENLKRLMQGFRYDAHPMGILVSTIGALSTFYPEAKDVTDLESRRVQTRRLIGKVPTMRAVDVEQSRRSPRSRIGTAAACPTSTPTTTSATPATSSRCCSR